MVLLASDFDKSKYLRAEDLKGPQKYRVKSVTSETFEKDGGKTEHKLVVWFTNDDRGLPLNKTNNRCLRGAFGDDTAGWAGKVIVVFPTTTDMRGKITPCLRVRIPPPKQPQAAVPQQPAPSGNGAAALTAAIAAVPPPPTAPAAAVVLDPELEPEPVKPIGDDLDDEIAF